MPDSDHSQSRTGHDDAGLALSPLANGLALVLLGVLLS